MDTADYAEIYRLNLDLLVSQLNLIRRLSVLFKEEHFILDTKTLNSVKQLAKNLSDV